VSKGSSAPGRRRGAVPPRRNQNQGTDAQEFELSAKKKALTQNWHYSGKPKAENEAPMDKERRYKDRVNADEASVKKERIARPWSAKARRENRVKKGGWAANEEGSMEGWNSKDGGIAGDWAGVCVLCCVCVIRMYLCVCMHVYICVCVCVCMCVCMCACVCLCLCVYMHTCVHTYIHIYVHIHTNTCLFMM
jgi:hypothetical protein